MRNVLGSGRTGRRTCESRSAASTAAPEPLAVQGDAESLRQVLVNLILNAIEAANRPGGPPPKVVVRLRKEAADRASVGVIRTRVPARPRPSATNSSSRSSRRSRTGPAWACSSPGRSPRPTAARSLAAADDMTCFTLELPLPPRSNAHGCTCWWLTTNRAFAGAWPSWPRELGHTRRHGRLGGTGPRARPRPQRPDVIVLDVRLPGMDGLSAMQHFQRALGRLPIIVMTAYGELATAVAAVRNGAFDYLTKPFDLSRGAAGDRAGADSMPGSGRRAAVRLPPARPAAGRSSAARRPCRRSSSGSPWSPPPTPASTSAARAARARSWSPGRSTATAAAADGPFVAVNMASLSPSLAESELFGHVRGAFTGAEQARKGLLEQADGGTIFLDEVADIPLALQVKLLRVLEHGEILPVGGDSGRCGAISA